MLRKSCLIIFIIFLLRPSYAQVDNDAIEIGTLVFNPPYELVVDEHHNSSGFNIEIIQDICQLINTKCNMKPMRFDRLMQALDNGEVDAIIIGVSLMPKNGENYIFSQPYFMGDAVFLSLGSNQFDSFNKKTIGSVQNTILPSSKYYDLIVYKNENLMRQYGLKFKFYNNLPQLLEALDTQDVDAIILDAGAAYYWQSQSSKHYQVVGPAVVIKQGMRIMALKDKKELITLFNNALKEMESNGELLRIYLKYWSSIHPEKGSVGILLPTEREY
ncbi:transporter substrate-binding domain-containing protein [Legionella israelensis]|nr:transporter substrate-binding domain-containing protein [Legionella israelensis]